jgi:hypothetical protein
LVRAAAPQIIVRRIVVVLPVVLIYIALGMLRANAPSVAFVDLRAVTIPFCRFRFTPCCGICNPFQFRMTGDSGSGFIDKAFSSHFQSPCLCVALTIPATDYYTRLDQKCPRSVTDASLTWARRTDHPSVATNVVRVCSYAFGSPFGFRL